MANLLNVDRALEQILIQIEQLPSEKMSLSQSLGCVLAQDIIADTNLPPFANSAVDGFALIATDATLASQDNPVTLPVLQDIPAGKAPDKPLSDGEAARIMTGAPLPLGATAVIPVEDTDSDWSRDGSSPLPESVTILKSIDEGANIRQIGENVREGDLVIHATTKLRAQEIGMLAALGHAEVPVYRKPRVAILGTGDELVDVHEAVQPGQIRDVNSYTLEALVSTYGGEPIRLPIAKDSLAEVRNLFETAIAHQPDIIISSAGVSVGTADLIHTILAEFGSIDFWRINMRPGKPVAFGKIAGVPFFGLPGNPVSAMVTFEVLVRPALLKMMGQNDNARYIHAITTHDMKSDGRRSFIRVKLISENGVLLADSTGTQSSGALMSMVLADGLLIIPEGTTFVPKGSKLQVRDLR